MAKRKRAAARRSTRTITVVAKAPAARRRRAPARRAPARRRRSTSARAGGFALMPQKHQMAGWAYAGAYGYLEKGAKEDDASLLNKVPKFIPQLGFTGNIAIALWVGGSFAKNRYARDAADSVAHIAAYQMGVRGSLFSEASEHFSLSGPGEALDVGEDELEEMAESMGAAADDDELSGDGDDFDE